LATGAKYIAIPPERTNGMTMLEYGSVVVRMAAIQASPAACRARPAAMIGRPPILSESRPAIGAMKIGIAVQGRIRSPDCSGEEPCTVWKY
jgi:hypothetical protein